MISIVLLILILLIPSFYISKKTNIAIEKVIPITIFSIILIIYVFGLINLLKIGVYCVFLLDFILLIANIVEFIKDKKYFNLLLKNLLKPSIVIWIFGIILLYFYYRGRMIVAWDEFSHWGDVVKMMYYNNIYNTNAASLSVARAYPPIMSIFQYFVENLSFKGFQEHYLFCAYHVFVISLILPFIRNVKWREIFKIILILIIILLAPTVFFESPYYYYNIIYIDPFLGIMFGYVMASIFVTKEYNGFNIICISLALFALTLTKDIAPVFSFICVLFLFFKFVIYDKNYKLLKKISKINLKKFFNKTKPLWIFFGVVIVSYLTWKINVMLNVKDISSDNPSTIKDVINALLRFEDTYRVTVVNNYMKRLSDYRFVNMGSIYTVTFVFILLSIIIYKNEDLKVKKHALFGFLSIYIGEFLYVFLMLVLYILMFSKYEALSLASFERYLSTYLMSILYFLIFITIYRSVELKKYSVLIILFVFILLNTNISLVKNNFVNYKEITYSTQVMRRQYSDAASSIRSKVDLHKKYKFYIIVQNSSGTEKWILRYEIRDILKEMNEGFTWSLGEKYNKKDIWTLNISCDEFEKILFKENYDYVYLFNIDDKFIDKYGKIFNYNDIKSGQLYKVNRKQNTIELVN